MIEGMYKDVPYFAKPTPGQLITIEYRELLLDIHPTKSFEEVFNENLIYYNFHVFWLNGHLKIRPFKTYLELNESNEWKLK